MLSDFTEQLRSIPPLVLPVPMSTSSINDDDVTTEKRFRSVREYRETKRLRKSLVSSDVSLSISSSEKDDFIKLLKDNVARVCHDRLGDDERVDGDSVPLWRSVSRLISQTLLDKESRMPVDLRYKVDDDRKRDNAVKRICGYTTEYLDRKYQTK